jgi:aspartate beta-hydroxylase
MFCHFFNLHFSHHPRINSQPMIDELQGQAKTLHQAGKTNNAAALHQQVLALDIKNTQSLTYIGLWHHAFGRAAEAITSLEQVVTIQPNAVFVHGKLGACYQMLDQWQQALNSYRQVLRLDENNADACIQAGFALHTLGRPHQAAAAFSIALQLRPKLASVAQSPSAPPQKREMVSRMIGISQQQIRSLYQQVYEEVAQDVGQSSCKRFLQMLEIELGMRAPQYADPRQRPFESYMPGLPSQPWFERSDFNWSDALEAQSEVMTQEFVQAVDSEVGLRPYVRGSKGGGDWSNLADSLQWSSLHLYENGRGQSQALQRYPQTAVALEGLPLVNCAGHSPEAFFSILRAGTHLPAHFGQANYKLTAHLPLIIPPKCGIKVGDETRNWVPGQCLVFNDTFLHEAWNDSQQDRAVLIFEVWNPHVEQAEIAAIQLLYQRLHRWLAGRRRMIMDDEYSANRMD